MAGAFAGGRDPAHSRRPSRTIALRHFLVDAANCLGGWVRAAGTADARISSRARHDAVGVSQAASTLAADIRGASQPS